MAFTKKRKTFIARALLITLIAADMAMIFALSAQTGGESGGVSGGITEKLLALIGVSRADLSENAFIGIEAFVRTAAHFAEYAVLGFAGFLLQATYSLRYRYSVLNASVFALVYAVSDEVHQLFVPGRGAQVSDVIIDACGGICGALAAMLLLLAVSAARTRIKRNKI